ncbi:peroxidase-related enzyme [Flavihumibacter sp. CACIAM 22H1]|uniref:carboxymuconolactone decarboxylase family protein n=1 Tax=Flavihumibacter sp. CACIAM 22H1 TaxID=1812911 RepID=UPI0007A8E68E|nr:peroxidase-related enzyme [Flavihumibacter sp. CACIAM 22H1]KYP14167.1 MAG: carboxymuconolactone decarboxylase [Flavihumibacter sp. CACIAM 22H1]
MAHIDLQNELPGIRGLMAYSPDTAKLLNELAELLLRNDENTLSRGERELIATYVSFKNDCFFCQQVHGALAGHYLNFSVAEIDAIKTDPQAVIHSEKLTALLQIAAAVQKGGKQVQEQHIAAARQAGATDKEIHDTVLIAAAFCMYNRYVDGLATWAPADRQFYVDRAPSRAAEGYINTPLNTTK